MSKIIVCPFCGEDIAVDEQWREASCGNCDASLDIYDWPNCTWQPPVDQDRARANDESCRGIKLCNDVIVLDKNSLNPVKIQIDLPGKIEEVKIASLHNHNGSWFVTVESDYNIYLNRGEAIRRTAELNAGDTLSVLGLDMHITADHQIKSGKRNLGVDDIKLQYVSSPLGPQKTLQIDQVNIAAGEFVGILGPSGCGKSSLLEILVGLRKKVYGRYLINNQPYREIFSRINFAYVPQDIALHPELTLSQEIDCFKQINMKTAVEQDTVNGLLRHLDLEKQKNNTIGNLSGGQRRRAGILLELLRDPAILFLDEPTAGLDPQSEQIVMQDLKSLSQQGRIVVCSTHIMNNIALFDKVIFMNEYAQLEFFGTPDELLKEYSVKNPIELYKIKTDKKDIFAENPTAKLKLNKFKFEFRHGGVNANEFCGYLKRMLLEISSVDWKKLWKTPWTLFNSSLGILFLQPIAIALVLRFSCADRFISYDDDLGFFCAVAVFWLGMNNAIRELVKERVPIRCLERLRGVKLGSYLGAKIFWMISLCAIQTILFFTTMRICPVNIMSGKEFDSEVIPFFSLSIFLILLLVCITGGFVGLAASAFNKKENTAICYLPMIIIPVLFFSHPIINPQNDYTEEKLAGKEAIDNNSEEHIHAWAKITYNIMPCNGARFLIKKIIDKDAKLPKGYNGKRPEIEKTIEEQRTESQNVASALSFTLKQLLSYIIVCSFFIYLFQNQKENAWGGR